MYGKILLFILPLIGTVLCQDPIVTITETDPSAISGIIEVDHDRDVTMSCLVENKQADKAVRWKKGYFQKDGGFTFEIISIDTSVEDNTKYSIEKPTAFTWRLRVKDAVVEDDGNYTCFVYTTRDNVKESNMTLKVAIQPYFNPDQTDSDTTVRQGDNIDLRCNATGRPHPGIMWTRLGGALLPIGKEIHYEPMLSIVNIQARDRGTYRCKAYNIIGGEVRQVIRDIQLDVRFPPIVQAVNAVVEQSLGCYRMELQCYIEANPFPLEGSGLMWYKGTRTFSQGSTFGRYKVQAVQGAFNRLTFELIIDGVRKEDLGTYRCQITNDMGVSSATVRLDESDIAKRSKKLGRVVTCGAGSTHSMAATVLSSLVAILAVLYHTT